MKNVMKHILVIGLLVGSAGMIKPHSKSILYYLEQAESEVEKGLDGATQDSATKSLKMAARKYHGPVNRHSITSIRAQFNQAIREVQHGQKEQALKTIKDLKTHFINISEYLGAKRRRSRRPMRDTDSRAFRGIVELE